LQSTVLNIANFPFLWFTHFMLFHSFRLSISPRLCGAILICFSLGFNELTVANDAPPPRQLKTFPLHNNPDSADISPDEQFVVTAIKLPAENVDLRKRQFVKVVQLWNFREDKLVAEFHPPQPDVKLSADKLSTSTDLSASFVRFSQDGTMVVALIQQTLYVLSSNDLSLLRATPISAPSNTAERPRIWAFELSPRGVAAVLWVTGTLYGTIALHDYASGKFLRSWETPQAWIGFTRGMAWDRDGKLLLVAIPDNPPCGSPGDGPDVFAFDVDSGAIKQKFRTGLTTGSIAVTGDRVLAVDENCVHVFTNHHPDLRVFEMSTGGKIGKVSGRGAGVRYRVSASANGNRFLAFTGIMTMNFDWSDGVPMDRTIDETFTIWNAADFSGVATSQNIPGLKSSDLRISAKGAYAVSYGEASFVYELP
jgi:WD40 repeat protein